MIDDNPSSARMNLHLRTSTHTDHHRVHDIDELLRDVVVDPGVAPGAVAGFALRTDSGWQVYVGKAGVKDTYTNEPVCQHTWYDLASITKSVFAFSLARAVDTKRLAWSDRLDQHLSFIAHTPAGSASLLSLVSHRSGLVAHVPLFLPLVSGQPVDRRQALIQAASSTQSALEGSVEPSGLEPFPALYSDLGYILAAEAVQQTFETSLDEWLANELERLALGGIASAQQLEARGIDVSQVAPTEFVPYRGGLVRAQVHDDNAWALYQTECAGHAGLFGTCEGVLRFGTLLLDVHARRNAALSQERLDDLLRPRPDGSLRAGFDGKSVGSSVVGQLLGPRTFGHLGFTGTSYFCDPDAECVVVLLTNRVCPSRDNVKIRQARPVVHDALAEMARHMSKTA